MREATAMLDMLADRLESMGMAREAEGVDAVSNTLDAAEVYDPGRIYPRSHPSNLMPIPMDLDKPGIDSVIMKYRDQAQPNIDSIKVALQQFSGILDRVSAEIPRLKPSVERYKKQILGMESDIESKLKDFLLFLLTEMGGGETLHSSIEHTQLSGG